MLSRVCGFQNRTAGELLVDDNYAALANYEPRVKEKADLLTERMRERARQPVNITKWAMFYSFDVIGEVAFSKDFGNLMTGTEHSALIPIHEHIKALGVLSPVPWLMNILTCLPAASNIYTEIFAFCADEIQAKQKVTLPCVDPGHIGALVHY